MITIVYVKHPAITCPKWTTTPNKKLEMTLTHSLLPKRPKPVPPPRAGESAPSLSVSSPRVGAENSRNARGRSGLRPWSYPRQHWRRPARLWDFCVFPCFAVFRLVVSFCGRGNNGFRSRTDWQESEARCGRRVALGAGGFSETRFRTVGLPDARGKFSGVR